MTHPDDSSHSFDEDLRNVMPWAKSHWSHTDLTRLKKGRISAQVKNVTINNYVQAVGVEGGH